MLIPPYYSRYSWLCSKPEKNSDESQREEERCDGAEYGTITGDTILVKVKVKVSKLVKGTSDIMSHSALVSQRALSLWLVNVSVTALLGV